MEELRSTDVLEKEILEEARRKAHRVLKTADDTIAAQKLDWDKKIEEDINFIRNFYVERTKKNNEDVFARLPLDKRRLRLGAEEKFLVNAMEEFLRSLDRETLLSILDQDLYIHLRACSEERTIYRASASYSGMNLAEARRVLGKVLKDINRGSLAAIQAEDWDFLELKGLATVHEFPYIVIDAQVLRIAASVENFVTSLMKDQRAELAIALLGEGVLND